MSDEDVKRHRDRVTRLGISEKIPPEKRGKKTCTACDGKGGRYVKHPSKPNTNVFEGCDVCKLHGEVPA